MAFDPLLFDVLAPDPNVELCEVAEDNQMLGIILSTHREYCRSQPETASDAVEEISRLEVRYWLVYHHGQPAGCASLRYLSGTHAEIRRFHVLEAYRHRGIATKLLDQLFQISRQRYMRRISLETGNTIGFLAARTLYSQFGFRPCGPFNPYKDHENSCFMTITL